MRPKGKTAGLSFYQALVFADFSLVLYNRLGRNMKVPCFGQDVTLIDYRLLGNRRRLLSSNCICYVSPFMVIPIGAEP